MDDDWRVTVDLDDEGDGAQLTEWLAALDLEAGERRRLGDRVIVSRDGARVYLYAAGEDRARAAYETVSARIEAEGLAAGTAFERWHPIEQAWKDVSVPLPSTVEELSAEHERSQQREADESVDKRRAAWEVRVVLPGHEETTAFAERLEAEGIPVVRRYTFLLAGAANEDEARALGERLEREAPAGARIEVEPGGGLVWEVSPYNPFAIFGGLGT